MADISITHLGGACPVQGEGVIEGWPFYFRSRGQRWSLSVAEPGFDPASEAVWEHSEHYSDEPYAAGWLTDDEARGLIARAAEAFVVWRRENPEVDGSGRTTAHQLKAELEKAWEARGEEARARLEAEREVVRLSRALGLNAGRYVIASVQVAYAERESGL